MCIIIKKESVLTKPKQFWKLVQKTTKEGVFISGVPIRNRTRQKEVNALNKGVILVYQVGKTVSSPIPKTAGIYGFTGTKPVSFDDTFVIKLEAPIGAKIRTGEDGIICVSKAKVLKICK